MNDIVIPAVTDYIGGEFLPPTVELTAVNANPHDNSPIAPQMATSPQNVERALETAWNVHQSGV